jgi:glycosyltransferase involved in cell wall biosynthesis
VAVLISIIIPSYNDGKNVQQLVKRIPKEDIVVVESGETAYFTSLPKHVRAYKGEKGRAKQMNLGANHAKGDKLLFLHADSKLSKLPVLGGTWGYFPVRFDHPGKYYRFIEYWSNLRASVLGPYGDQGIFVDKNYFNKVGQYDERALFEDITLGRSLKKLHPPTVQEANILTSARRFEQHGPVKTHAIMGGIHVAYLLGMLTVAKWLYTLIQ